jgi:hypothetical protein
MKNHSLSTKGLSMSQAQSVSNLCNQASRDIESKLSNINNASKVLTLNGHTYIETKGNPIMDNVKELLNRKASLHATQAFLMENIRQKQTLLDELKRSQFTFSVPEPEYPKLMDDIDTTYVDENWGWNQLTASEYNEYLESEAFASHFGQFIHKNGKLDKLRNELPTMKTLEWIEVEEGKKTPLNVMIHHTIDQLGGIHEDLAAVHRKHEQRVNYYKAKVKNLVTTENARLAKEYGDKQAVINEHNQILKDQFIMKRNEWLDERKKANFEFEENRQKEISRVSGLRIAVDVRFKNVVDSFLDKIDE